MAVEGYHVIDYDLAALLVDFLVGVRGLHLDELYDDAELVDGELLKLLAELLLVLQGDRLDAILLLLVEDLVVLVRLFAITKNLSEKK